MNLAKKWRSEWGRSTAYLRTETYKSNEIIRLYPGEGFCNIRATCDVQYLSLEAGGVPIFCKDISFHKTKAGADGLISIDLVRSPWDELQTLYKGHNRENVFSYLKYHGVKFVLRGAAGGGSVTVDVVRSTIDSELVKEYYVLDRSYQEYNNRGLCTYKLNIDTVPTTKLMVRFDDASEVTGVTLNMCSKCNTRSCLQIVAKYEAPYYVFDFDLGVSDVKDTCPSVWENLLIPVNNECQLTVSGTGYTKFTVEQSCIKIFRTMGGMRGLVRWF